MTPAPGTRARFVIAAAALLGAYALTLQLALTVRLVLRQGDSVLAAVWLYLDYFTVLTNGLLVAVMAVVARGPRGPLGRALTQPASLTAIATSILIVGLVYNLILRGSWHPTGWQRLADELLHGVMPLIGLAFWWWQVRGLPIRPRPLLTWLLYPLGYLGYALVRGAADGHYPYPFLDAASLGLRQVLLNATGVALTFAVVGGLLLAIAHRRPL